MMLYNVDTERINRQLHYLGQCLSVVEESRGMLDKGEPLACFAAARALHIGVECVIDVGSTMIDGFIMRDPGGYSDIIDILEDEQVIPTEEVDRLKKLIRFRDRLMRHYVEVTPEDLRNEAEDVDVFRSFTSWVQEYLRRELGPEAIPDGEGRA